MCSASDANSSTSPSTNSMQSLQLMFAPSEWCRRVAPTLVAAFASTATVDLDSIALHAAYAVQAVAARQYDFWDKLVRSGLDRAIDTQDMEDVTAENDAMVTVMAAETEISVVPRSQLCRISPVWASMLQSGFAEGTSLRITVDAELESGVRFMLTREIDSIDAASIQPDKCFAVYHAADYLDARRVVDSCLRCLFAATAVCRQGKPDDVHPVKEAADVTARAERTEQWVLRMALPLWVHHARQGNRAAPERLACFALMMRRCSDVMLRGALHAYFSGDEVGEDGIFCTEFKHDFGRLAQEEVD
jgi:hypothetical protein